MKSTTLRDCLRFLVLSAAWGVVLASNNELHAQWGGFGLYGPYAGYNLYGLDDIPYFAKHPPVYYSRPVARPYGFSPYAYLPYVVTPSAPVVHRAPEAKFITNPYLQEDSSETEGTNEASLEGIKTAETRKFVYPIAEFGPARLAKH